MAIPNPNKKTTGELLKEARTSKGISLTSVHEGTKIPLDVLRAIEEGYTVRTLSPFYLKGFVKMYAQYLGVNVDIDTEQKLEEKKAQPQLVPPPRKLIVAKEIHGPWAEGTGKIFSRRRQRQAIQLVGILFVVFCVVKIGGCMIRKRPKRIAKRPKISIAKSRKKDSLKKKEVKPVKKKRATLKKVTQKPAPVKTVAKVPQPKPKDKVKAAKAAPKASPKKKVDERFKLTITAQRRGWLQVKVDGNLVFQSTMKEGVTETWKAKDMIEISGKSIHYLDYQLNGKKIDGVKDPGKTARRVVITKKGLSVKR